MSIVTVPAPSQTSQRPPATLNENMPAVTPFNGEHNAGVQALSTCNFPDQAGPLRQIH